MLRNMDVWQALLLFVAAYVAVNALVRLLRARRDAVAAEFRQNAADERARRAREEAEKKRKPGQAA
jgi:hypothetical protein